MGKKCPCAPDNNKPRWSLCRPLGGRLFRAPRTNPPSVRTESNFGLAGSETAAATANYLNALSTPLQTRVESEAGMAAAKRIEEEDMNILNLCLFHFC